VTRFYLDPWTFLRAFVEAERLEDLETLWPRFQVARRELLTLCRDGDRSAELEKLTRAVGRSPLLAGRWAGLYRTAMHELLADAWAVRPRQKPTKTA
jgi:hypothetical protein